MLKKLERREIKKQFKAWALAVKERDEKKCVICSRTTYIHAHHILPRELKLFRFEVLNGITLCANHHKFSTAISPHKNPLVFVNWFINNRTQQYINLYALWISKGGL